jgi:NAD-dependent deacetylase
MEWQQVERAALLLHGASSAVAITGAGVSTPSGVPDFRGPHGLWKTDPAASARLSVFQNDPRSFIDWFRPLLLALSGVQPNPAHVALARLEQLGRLEAVLTQNIDGLHQRAGSRQVYELHGHLRTATCLECDRQIQGDRAVEAIRRGALLPCVCGGVFKPDIVLFDEALSRGLLWLAQRALDRADVVLIAGTSLEVAPVCDLPVGALKRGAHLVIVNQSATSLDQYADVVLRADVAEALPAIAGRVEAVARSRAV